MDAAADATTTLVPVRPRLYLLPSFPRAPHGLALATCSNGVRRN